MGVISFEALLEKCGAAVEICRAEVEEFEEYVRTGDLPKALACAQDIHEAYCAIRDDLRGFVSEVQWEGLREIGWIPRGRRDWIERNPELVEKWKGELEEERVRREKRRLGLFDESVTVKRLEDDEVTELLRRLFGL